MLLAISILIHINSPQPSTHYCCNDSTIRFSSQLNLPVLLLINSLGRVRCETYRDCPTIVTKVSYLGKLP